jgi:nucleoid-associated protein YgaU
MHHLASGSRARCLAVWLLAGAGTAATVAWAAPDLAVAGLAGAPFERWLVWLAAVALTGCAAWAWVVTGVVVGRALAGRPRAAVRGVPRWLQAGVLLACGLAVVGTGATASADDDTARALDGLPYPDRAVGSVAVARVHVVQPGDTLWDIADADLGGRPDAAAVTRHWHRIHALNRAVIGADPDLIHPGQLLRMPAPQRH